MTPSWWSSLHRPVRTYLALLGIRKVPAKSPRTDLEAKWVFRGPPWKRHQPRKSLHRLVQTLLAPLGIRQEPLKSPEDRFEAKVDLPGTGLEVISATKKFAWARANFSGAPLSAPPQTLGSSEDRLLAKGGPSGTDLELAARHARRGTKGLQSYQEK